MTASASLLALALAASGLHAPPLQDCEATQLRHGWQYQCGGVKARVEDLREGDDVDVTSHLAGLAAAAPALVGEGAVTRVERRKLGREEVEVRITRSPARSVLVAALPRPAGTRVLACVVERSLSCDAALE